MVRPSPDAARPAALRSRTWLRGLLWACLGALLILLISQFPARHAVDIGGYDSAYVQGFLEPEIRSDLAEPVVYLAGSDGSVRWSGPAAALIFPQAGLPAELTLRLRGVGAQPTPVRLLLNGEQLLAEFALSDAWIEQTVAIPAGRLKPNDFFVVVQVSPTELPDGRLVGALLDRVTYRTTGLPVLPYPAQLLYAALIGGLLALLLPRPRLIGLALLGYGLLWWLLYRDPLLYPFPLTWFPLSMVAALAGWFMLRHVPPLLARRPWLLSSVAPTAIVLGWGALILRSAEAHVTLARPGVENDFRVFATRETLAQVFSADGFYNLGYPLLLWLVRPLTEGNAFLAGRVLAALCGMLLLLACYLLARALLPSGPALAALMVAALSGTVAQYGLYVGSDMPFAAMSALAMAALVWALRQSERRLLWAIVAGLCGGLSFLMRHPGLLLLPWGMLVLGLSAYSKAIAPSGRNTTRIVLAFAVAFLLAASPQLIVNTMQTGAPLYNQQAKNIWLAVFGGADWGRWDEAPNSIGLSEVILRDPPRFLTNWFNNLRAFVGTGAEDTSEFGRAIQLRLLGWPANWLAIAGLLGWLWHARRFRTVEPAYPALLSLIALYVAAVSTAFALPRFFLPLTPIYALAAAWLLAQLMHNGRTLAVTSTLLIVVLWSGFVGGRQYVLDLQPADEVAAVQMVQTVAADGAPIAARVAARLPLAKYSAIAHRVVNWPAGGDTTQPVSAAELESLRAQGARYLLWDEAAGPPPLADPTASYMAGSGRYALYRLEP